MRSRHLLKTPDQRREVQSRHPSMETIGDPTVVPLAEFITQIGVDDRIAEPGEIFPVVTENVTVVERNHVALSAGQDISEGHPAAAAFALQSGIDFSVGQELEDVLDAGPIVIDDPDSLRAALKKIV